MKRILGRTWIIYVFVAMCLIGLAFLTARTVIFAPEWVQKSADYGFNGHIVMNSARTGKIYDRNGKTLAKTTEKGTKFTKDKELRKALLHVVGDSSRSISTAILSRYGSDEALTDYNFITGLKLPGSFRKKAGTSGDIILTVDAETCKAAYNALSEYDSGACVIYNYRTGEIICDVSHKSYDPVKPPKITEKNEDKYEGVYLDNAISSTYTPGSIFKIVTTAAALEYIPDVESRTWTCEGTHKFGSNTISCSDGEAHGTINLEEAFEYSCNYVFADLAVKLGPDKMNATARKMGINASFDISGISTKNGHFDVSDADTHELAMSGMGQHTTLVNPIQMMTLCGAIANGGTPVIPYIISSDLSSLLLKAQTDKNGSLGDDLLDPAIAAKIHGYMRTASISYSNWYVDGLTLCAKTGTAELGNGKQNGWVVGFSEDEDCPLAFACVVHKISGDTYGLGTAGSVAMQALAQARQIYY